MAQGGRSGVLIQSGRTDVVISTPSQRDFAREAARLSWLVQGCRQRLDITPADSATFVTAEVPDLSAVRGGQDLLVLFVLPHQASSVDCDDEEAQHTIVAMRGLRVATDTTYAPDRDLQRVILRRGAELVPALVERREPLRRLVPGGIREPRMRWIVLAVDATHLAPGPNGVAERVTIEVRSAAGGIPEVFELPWTAVRDVWERAIVARTTPDLDALLRQPGDARQRLEARARAGAALAMRGDSVAARIVLGALLATEPCFSFASATDVRVRDLLEAMRRPDARSAAQSPLRTFARAAVLPGFGRPGTADGPMRRVAFATVIAAGALMAMHQSRTANDRYEEYLALQNVSDQGYDIAFGRVEDARLMANRLGAAAFALWTAQIVRSLWLEHRYAAHLAGIRGFDASSGAPSIGLAAFVDADRVGIMGRIGW